MTAAGAPDGDGDAVVRLPGALLRGLGAAAAGVRRARDDERARAVEDLVERAEALGAAAAPGNGIESVGASRRRRIGAYGLATSDLGVLMVRVAAGYPGAGRWTLPGGGLDHGEHPLDGLVREYHEETGLPVRIREFLVADSHHLVDDRRGEDLHLLRLVWRVEAPTDVAPRVVEQHGSTAVAEWVDRDRLRSLPLLGVAVAALRAVDEAAPPPDRSDGAV